ncbi:FecR family protein [Flavihumibacter solisilvae]|nr:FecR family protein [Flavihumibacter solisilvae]
MASTSNIVSILWRYQQREILTEEEVAFLGEWLNASTENQILFDDLSNDMEWDAMIQSLQLRDPDPNWVVINNRIKQIEKARPRLSYWARYAVAAAVIGLVMTGTYFYMQRQATPSDSTASRQPIAEILPGHNSVVLVGAGGRVITLDSIAPGNSVGHGTYRLDSVGKGSLSYDGAVTTTPELYTVQTPRGKQFNLVLGDGTRVWLNATTQLTYPEKFTGLQRIVELVGEAYFEVATNKAQPFIVRAAGSSTEVTGTQFNIQSYKDEGESATTLVEGGVIIRRSEETVRLVPGQQAIVRQQGIQKLEVDTEPIIAWRKAVFWFENATYETIMTELARWYPIDVHFTAPIQERYSGILPRDLPLSKLLSLLEKGGKMHFEINGNTVTVNP